MAQSVERELGRPDEAPHVSRCRLEAASAAEVVSTSGAREPTAFTGARFLRFRFVHGQGPAVHLRAIEGRDGGLGLFGRRHLDEAEAPRLPGEFVRHHARRFNGAMCGKQSGDLRFGCRIRQTANVQFRTHGGPPSYVILSETRERLGKERAEDAVRRSGLGQASDHTLGDNIGDGPYRFMFHARPGDMKVTQRSRSPTY